MEDLHQRRQRLAAMREQADLEETVGTVPLITTPAPGNSLNLPNPMMDSAPIAATETNKSSGFDFYTDPLTAFTNGKRRRSAIDGGVPGGASSQWPLGVQAPQGPPTTGPPPYFHAPSMHPSRPALPGNSEWQPIPSYKPPHLRQFPGVPPPPPPYGMPQPRGFPNQSEGRGRDIGYGGRGRNLESVTGGRGGYSGNFPGEGRGYGNNNAWGSERGAVNSGGYSNRGGPGRGQARGGHRGRGGRVGASAREQPHLFFKTSMTEDPWKQLEAKMQRT